MYNNCGGSGGCGDGFAGVGFAGGGFTGGGFGGRFADLFVGCRFVGGCFVGCFVGSLIRTNDPIILRAYVCISMYAYGYQECKYADG